MTISHSSGILYGKMSYLLLATLLTMSAYAQSNGNQLMKTVPPVFENIPLGRMEPSECTPDVLSDWDYRGIKLNAPEKVIVSEVFVLPLCGAWQFSYKFLNRFDNVFSMVQFVVTDKEDFKSYSGSLMKPGLNYQKRITSIGTDEQLQNRTSSVSFNIDVYDYVVNLPQKPGTYLIYALVGDIKSNVVEIKIEVMKGSNPTPREPSPM